MRIKRKIQIVTASCQALGLIFITPLVAMAEEATPTGFSNNKLDNFEQVIYGAPRKNLSQEARLKALEIKLFGEAKSGSYDSRIAGIQKALAYGRTGGGNSDLLPPLAPTLDTASTSSRTASAPPAGKGERFDAGSSSGGNDYSLPDSTKAVADAMQLYTNGKVDQAEQAFRKIIANDPNNGDAYYNLGVIAEGRGDLKGALNDYKQAQRISPQDQDLRDTVTSVSNKLAAAGANAGNPNIASAGGPQAAPPRGKHGGGGAGSNGAGASSADRLRLKGMVDDASVKYKNGDYDGAIGELGQVANEAPGDADVQFALGQAYKAKGDLGRARTAMSRAAALDPNNSSYQNALAALTTAAAGTVASAGGGGGTGITPFAGSHAQSGGGGMSGFSSHASSGMSRRLTRAVEFGIAGAAIGGLTGAMFRPNYGYGYGYGYGRPTGYSSMRSGALRGAVTGSLLGLIFGR